MIPLTDEGGTVPYGVKGYEAVKPEVLPASLRKLVARFCASHPSYATHSGATGQCYSAANLFLNFLRAAGYVSYPEDLIGHRYLLDEIAVIEGCSHHAALVDEFLVDFTARQFDSDAPFPLIWREAQSGRKS